MLTHVYIEVDAISTSPARRLYGYVIAADGDAKGRTVTGYGETYSTSRGACIAAIASALERFRKPAEVHIHAADSWLLGCLDHALENWAKNGWKTKKGQEIRHKEHWERLWKARAGLLLVPEAERYNAYSKWLQEEIEKRKEDGNV